MKADPDAVYVYRIAIDDFQGNPGTQRFRAAGGVFGFLAIALSALRAPAAAVQARFDRAVGREGLGLRVVAPAWAMADPGAGFLDRRRFGRERAGDEIPESPVGGAEEQDGHRGTARQCPRCAENRFHGRSPPKGESALAAGRGNAYGPRGLAVRCAHPSPTEPRVPGRGRVAARPRPTGGRGCSIGPTPWRRAVASLHRHVKRPAYLPGRVATPCRV